MLKSNKLLVSIFICILLNACKSEKDPFRIINASLKSEIDNFLSEAKKSHLYRGKNIILSIFPDYSPNYRIILINDIPNDCQYFVSLKNINSVKVYLLMDSLIIDDNPLVEVIHQRKCEINKEFGMPTIYFSKEYLFQENKLHFVN